MKKLLALTIVLVLSVLSSLAFAEVSDQTSELLDYDQANDVVFNIKIDDKRIFTHPEDMIPNKSKTPWRCQGITLWLFPTFDSSNMSLHSATLFIYNNDKLRATSYDVDMTKIDRVLDCLSEVVDKVIDYDNGGKFSICVTQSLDETLILFEYSPKISEHSDEDVFRTQNYAEYDDYEVFKGDVNAIIDAFTGGNIERVEEEGEDSGFKELKKGSKGEDVKRLQNRLNELGYSVGKADGDYGNKTKTAVEQFQKDNNLSVTGVIDENTYNALFPEDNSGNIPEDDKAYSDLVVFESTMMESVSDQISSATDLTTTSTNRAVLAALLSLEFANQKPDFEIDYSLPIYVCKQGNIASVAIGGTKDYALVIFQMNPLSTSYGIFEGNDPATIKATLDTTNENVWQVSLDEYNEKLAGIVDQIS